MSEGASGFPSIDSSNFVYIPNGIKFAVAGILAASLLASLAVSLFFAIGKGKDDIAIFALSFAQLCALSLAVGLVALYSEREAGISLLQKKADNFLDGTMQQGLEKITISDPTSKATINLVVHRRGAGQHRAGAETTDIAKKDIFGRLYTCRIGEGKNALIPTFKLWLGLNVYRIFVIYLIEVQPDNAHFAAWRANRVSSAAAPGPHGRDTSANGDDTSARDADFATWLREEAFKFTFGGAEKVGYSANFECVQFGADRLVSIWLTVEAAPNFLTNPAQKLFWSQDIAMMTESYIRTALRHELELQVVHSPGPI
jgi:hypothetical protein